MSRKKVTVVATFKAKAGMEDILKNACLALIEPTRAEPGCITYDFHQSCDDQSHFMFYENWMSKEELNKHLEMPHLKKFLGKVPELVAEPGLLTFWEMLT